MQWPCLYRLTLHQKLVSALMMIPYQVDILFKLKMIYYTSNHICLPDLLFCSCTLLSSNPPFANVLFSLSKLVVKLLASVLFLHVRSMYVRLQIGFTEGEASLGECCRQKPAADLWPRVLKEIPALVEGLAKWSLISSNSESSFVWAEVAVTCLNRNSRWLISLKYLGMVIKINLTISSLIKKIWDMVCQVYGQTEAVQGSGYDLINMK